MDQVEVDVEQAVLTLAWRQDGDADGLEIMAERSLDLDVLGGSGTRVVDPRGRRCARLGGGGGPEGRVLAFDPLAYGGDNGRGERLSLFRVDVFPEDGLGVQVTQATVQSATSRTDGEVRTRWAGSGRAGLRTGCRAPWWSGSHGGEGRPGGPSGVGRSGQRWKGEVQLDHGGRSVRFWKSFRHPLRRRRYGCIASTGRLEGRHGAGAGRDRLEDAHPAFLARLACAVDTCGAGLAGWVPDDSSTWGQLRLRFRKNSLFAAKVIMVLISTALHDTGTSQAK